MALVAILSARTSNEPGVARQRGTLVFGGQPLVEYQARQARVAGAESVLILADGVDSVLIGIVDRLAADGLRAALVRDMPTLGRSIGDNDDVLLIAEGVILPHARLAELTAPSTRDSQAAIRRISTLPAGPATRLFERIDGDAVWAGALAVPASTLIGLIDMLGDWDLSLSLLREALAEGATRLPCDMADLYDGRIVIVTDQPTADAATRTLARGKAMTGEDGGDVDDWLAGWPAAALAPIAIRHGITAAAIRNGGIAVALIGNGAVIGGFVAGGLLLCFGALVADRLAARLDRLLRLTGSGGAADHGVRILGLLALFLTGMLSSGGSAIAMAGAAVFLGILTLQPLLVQRGLQRDVPDVTVFAPGAALLLLVLGAALDIVPVTLAICIIAAFASHAWQLWRD